MRWTVWLVGWLFILGCEEAPPTAREVIDRAVAAHGMTDFDSVGITFVFREREYEIRTEGERYTYGRQFRDSLGNDVSDRLDNDGLRRYVNDSLVRLTAKDSTAFAGSVNSVRYFVMLPYALGDPAVNTRLLDLVQIDAREYQRVEVTFDEAGGGQDFDDVYHYFFDKQTGEMDYLAYTFAVEGGGIRFREAINKRRVEGVLLQDYINYGLDGHDHSIDSVVALYRTGRLPELSRIENTRVTVSR